MSASRERKKRQESQAGGAVSKKAARAAERKAAERRSNILYASIAVLFVIIAVLLVVYNSGIFQRNETAVTIGDDTYTAADLSYYYYQALNKVYADSYGYTSMIGLDLNSSFKDQAAWGSTEEDAQTWDEYFKEQAVEMMRYVTAAKAAAEEEGFTLSEDDEASITDAIDSMKSSASSNGSSYSSYLKSVYGNLMTTDCYEKNVRDSVLASAYATAYSDSLTYTADEVQAVYEADPAAYDKVEYMLVTIDGSAESTEDEEGNTVEPTEEETAAAWSSAQDTAQLILDSYDAGEDLETVAEDFDNATYSYSEGASNSSTGAYVEWCFEDGRQAGDTTIIEDEDNSTIYVVVFLNRYLDETKTVNVRHILITEDSVDVADDVVPMDEEIEARAEEVLAMWDGTEDGFADLAREYSQDSTASDGGYYHVVKDQTVTEFDAWCFDDARQSGDTAIIHTTYGYHIMYFVGDDQPEWYLTAEDSLRSEDLTAWEDDLVAPYEAVTHEKGMGYVGR